LLLSPLLHFDFTDLGVFSPHFSQVNQGSVAGIAEVLNLKGLRAGMNRQDKTHIKRASRLMTNWQNLIFLSQLYTKEE
jgi:hypothetical protein